MWAINLSKAESLLGLNNFEEAKAIVNEFEKSLEKIIPDEGIGTALHQLGNSFVNVGEYEYADKCYNNAIIVRTYLIKHNEYPELKNLLAGSYKMKASWRIGLFKNNQNLELIVGAAAAINKSLDIRLDLLDKLENSNNFLHDLAMTAYTKATIEGTLSYFTNAMNDLNYATGIMNELVKEEEGWAPDLGYCLADQVLYGIGANAENGLPPPLDEAEKCLYYFNNTLSDFITNNKMIRIKYFEFLGEAAIPAAYGSRRTDISISFIESGLRQIETIMRSNKYITKKELAIDTLSFFKIPVNVLEDLFKRGLNKKRYEELFQELISEILIQR